jgi:hypothetical protein
MAVIMNIIDLNLPTPTNCQVVFCVILIPPYAQTVMKPKVGIILTFVSITFSHVPNPRQEAQEQALYLILKCPALFIQYPCPLSFIDYTAHVRFLHFYCFSHIPQEALMGLSH